MSGQLDGYVEKEVSIVTTDGNYYVGVLKGFDQATNLYLSNGVLITWNPMREDIGVENIVIRGDTVVLVALREGGELPEEGRKIAAVY